MIISASYKTDVPAFYGRWFLNRLRAGYCRMVNPYNQQTIRVDLRPEAVDGFVFWSRNFQPFLPVLQEVHARGLPFMLQLGISGYPRALERSVIRTSQALDQARLLADRYGPKALVWRYDTILFSSLTPPDFHRRTFETLARALAGSTDEVVISFAQQYQKTRRNLDLAARTHGFAWEDPADEVKYSLLNDLLLVARAHGLTLSLCAQPGYVVEGTQPARCIDARRLERLAGRPLRVSQRGNRPGCGCYASRDIGAYHTCLHGCTYCYAVKDRETAQRHYRQHNPDSELLLEPEGFQPPEDPPLPALQQRLF